MEKTLRSLVPDMKIFYYEELASTNTRAAELARGGQDGIFAVIARRQSAGRGRLGRSFYSGEGGLYMSIVLRPQNPDCATLLTTAAAVAAAESIEEISGRKTQIKWVNDVFIDKKKVCGILAEAEFSQNSTSPDFAVVGIGVNLLPPEGGFPAEIAHIAGAVLEEGRETEIARLAAGIITRFSPMWSDLKSRQWYDAYLARLNCLDTPVCVRQGESSRRAVTLALDRDFRLLARFEDGSKQWLSFGEISLQA